MTTCRVPADLGSVTGIGTEVPARDAGVDPAGVARIWRAVERLYATGTHPAIQLCVRREGRVILDRAIGHARGNAPTDPPGGPTVLASPSTPFNIFSAAKAVTAMVIHLLDQRGFIRLDDAVSEYLPGFAVRKKRWITIRHVLVHRAGLANPPPEAMDLARLEDPEGIVQLLCEMPLTGRPGSQLAYHAVTGGFILGELVRRVTGQTIREVHDEAVRRPLGFRWLSYGVPPEEVDLVAQNAFTGPPPLPPLSILLGRSLGVDFRRAIEMSNDPRFLTAIVPSGNVIATANEFSRFFQLLLEGGTLDGVRVFDPRTIRRAITEQSYLELDLTLALPFRYGMGFMLGGRWLSPYGPDTPYAVGHIGFTNVIGWADPERQVSAALLTSGKPLVYPGLYHVWDVLRQIGRTCGKLPFREWAPSPARPSASRWSASGARPS
jgi:CubicO group peptidase (beta-lactamase class C family)